MTCCLMAPMLIYHQGVPCNSPEGEFTRNATISFLYLYESENNKFETLSPEQKGFHFTDDVCIFCSVKCCILIRMSLKFVPNCPFSNNPALVQLITWRRSGDKPLFESMVALFIDSYCTFLCLCCDVSPYVFLVSFTSITCHQHHRTLQKALEVCLDSSLT